MITFVIVFHDLFYAGINRWCSEETTYW